MNTVKHLTAVDLESIAGAQLLRERGIPTIGVNGEIHPDPRYRYVAEKNGREVVLRWVEND